MNKAEIIERLIEAHDIIADVELGELQNSSLPIARIKMAAAIAALQNDKASKELTDEIEKLKARLVVDEEAMEHMRKIKEISFTLWYDPDNAACARYGRMLEPHIKALNDKFEFRR